MSDEYFDLITGKPLEPWAQKAMDRRPMDNVTDQTRVTVPRKPTEAMLDAFWHQTGESKEMRTRVHHRAKLYWSAMLSAAPATPHTPASAIGVEDDLRQEALECATYLDGYSTIVAEAMYGARRPSGVRQLERAARIMRALSSPEKDNG